MKLSQKLYIRFFLFILSKNEMDSRKNKRPRRDQEFRQQVDPVLVPGTSSAPVFPFLDTTSVSLSRPDDVFLPIPYERSLQNLNSTTFYVDQESITDINFSSET